MRHLEIILAPQGHAVIESYLNGRRMAISRALPCEAARTQARETKLPVIDHTRTG
jgi:hypothetical protein